jgi:Bacterial aa3 type cytochrome c oxidase subunit IV
MVEQEHAPTAEDFVEHEQTYRYFVKGVFLFAAHVLVILLILAWVFADSFGNAPLTG